MNGPEAVTRVLLKIVSFWPCLGQLCRSIYIYQFQASFPSGSVHSFNLCRKKWWSRPQPSNYCSIAKYFNICYFQPIIHRKVWKYLNASNINSDSQYAFIKEQSTNNFLSFISNPCMILQRLLKSIDINIFARWIIDNYQISLIIKLNQHYHCYQIIDIFFYKFYN